MSVRKYFIVIITVLAASINLRSQIDTIYHLELRDSVDIFETKNDLIGYYAYLRRIEDKILKSNWTNLLNQTNKYYPGFRPPLDSLECHFLRKTITYHASKIKKQYGYLEALPYYEYAHRWATCSSDPTHFAWYIERELAQAYHRLGDLAKARYFYNLTVSLIRESMPQKIPLLWSDLALIYIAEGNIDDALKLFRKGYNFYYPEQTASIDILRGKMANAHGIADLYSRLNLQDSAFNYIHQVEPELEAVRNMPNGTGYYVDHFSIKGNILSLAGRNSAAIEAYTIALDNARKMFRGEVSRETAKLYQKLSQTYFDSGEWETADSLVQLGYLSLIPGYSINDRYPQLEKIYAENTFFDLMTTQAEIYKHRYYHDNNPGLIDTALHLLAVAWSANDQLSTRYSRSNSGFLTSADNKKLYDHAITYIASSYDPEDFQKTENQILSLSKHLKGNILKQSKKENCRFNALSDSMQDIVQTLDKQLVNWRSQVAVKPLLQDSLFPLIEKTHNSIQASLNKADSSCNENFTKTVSGYFVEYIFSEDSLLCIDNFNGQFRITKLGNRDTIQTLVSRLQVVLSEKTGYRKVCRLLYQQLIHSIRPLPEKFRIIADGVLTLLPFEVLIDENNDFLVNNHLIHYDYFIDQSKNALYEVQNPNLLILKPRYEQAPEPLMALRRDNEYALNWADSEIDDISSSWNDKFIIKEPLEKDSFAQWVSNYDILHFAGHARTSGNQAWLLLRNWNEENLRLRDYEIAGIRNDLDLVVLSACETGLGQFIPGEGLMSLGRSFIQSGTKTSVMSLWQVNDESTSTIMSRFYKNLQKGQSISESITNAKRQYLKQADPERQHPYYWSGFVVYGQDHQIVKKSYLGWLLILLFLPIVYWIHRHRKLNLK